MSAEPDRATAARRTRRLQAEIWLRRAGHRRLADLVGRRPWWDWGHRMMALTGDDFGGNWDAPTMRTWWYRAGPAKPMWRTKYPQHPLSTIEVVTDYERFRSLTKGLNEDQMYEWSAINFDQDGDLQLGKRYWGGTFYALRPWEMRLVLRYLLRWRLHDWLGLRSWLYSQGLEAAVHQRKPRSCQEVPPRGSGGYDHWHCERRRRHEGLHRYRNYTWDGAGRVEHAPVVAAPGSPEERHDEQ